MSIETRAGFHQQIADVEKDVVRTAARVCESIAQATEAVLDSDAGMATAVGDSDVVVARACREAEARIYALIACQQPSAGDLRALMTVLRLLPDLGRASALARNIAEASRRVPGYALPPRLRGLVAQMGAEAQQLCTAAIDAWTDRDPVAAARLAELDQVLDDLHRRFLAELFAGVVPLRTTVELTLVARYFERIGDHAVAIGDHVVQLVVPLSLSRSDP